LGKKLIVIDREEFDFSLKRVVLTVKDWVQKRKFAVFDWVELYLIREIKQCVVFIDLNRKNS
jgi:hypothetical protein